MEDGSSASASVRGAEADCPGSEMPFVVYILGLTIFALTTSEFMVAGMLPSLASALAVSVGEIGNLISLYALGMAIGGPVLTVLLLVRGLPNKQALLWLLAIYVAAGIVAACASGYGAMAAARIVMGVVSAAAFGVSLTICAELVAPEARGKAASFVLGGLMLAPVLGVPATAIIEQSLGWRASFWSVAMFSAVCAVSVVALVGESKGGAVISLKRELAALCNPGLWAAYATSGLIIGATFAAFSYLVPIFTQVSGFAPSAIPMLLAMYGAANVVGNLIVGRFADRYTLAVLAIGLAALGVFLAIFALYAESGVASVGALLGIGFTGVALNPAMVARVMKTADPGPLVNTMHTSVITAGLAAGTWAAGVGIDAGWGLRAPLWIGAVLALLGLMSLALAGLSRREP